MKLSGLTRAVGIGALISLFLGAAFEGALGIWPWNPMLRPLWILGSMIGAILGGMFLIIELPRLMEDDDEN